MFLVALIGVVLATACGGGDDDADSSAATATTGGAAATATTGGAATQPSGGEGNAENGKTLAAASCAACHSVDGSTLVGPSWKGLYGRTVELEGGTTVTADDAYIKESILDPNAKIVKGFPPAMPPFKGILSDAQIADIIAYIKTLQ